MDLLTAPSRSAHHGPRDLRRGNLPMKGAAVEPENARGRGDSVAFLKRRTYQHQELAEATSERNVWRALQCHLDQHRRFDLSQKLSIAMCRSNACSPSSQVPAPRPHPQPSH
eukprot:3690887-Pyramimonas_sp.AAC.1